MEETLKSKIMKLRESGCSFNEIRLQLKCAKSTISYHVNNEGLGGIIKRKPEFINDLDIDVINQIKLLRQNDKTYDEILQIISITKDQLKKEVDKCILVCANCHIEIHEKERHKNN